MSKRAHLRCEGPVEHWFSGVASPFTDDLPLAEFTPSVVDVSTCKTTEPEKRPMALHQSLALGLGRRVWGTLDSTFLKPRAVKTHFA